MGSQLFIFNGNSLWCANTYWRQCIYMPAIAAIPAIACIAAVQAIHPLYLHIAHIAQL
jgi:hypothetical protein